MLSNRIGKAAMAEGLSADNVLVDRLHLERGGNLAIVGEQSVKSLAMLTKMAMAAKTHGSAIWMQLYHAG